MKENKQMKTEEDTIIEKSFIAGVISILLLASFYFVVLTWISGDWEHPWQQFLTVKYWMSALFLGFGIQGGLFWYSRLATKIKKTKNIATANAGVSSATMIACCAHHVVDFIPVLGVSAFAILLAKYQVYFLGAGVFFNGIGILYMYKVIRKYKLYIINESKA